MGSEHEQGSQDAVLLIAIHDGTVVIAPLSEHFRDRPVWQFLNEHLWHASHEVGRHSRTLYDVLRDRVIDEHKSLREADVRDGDILVFGASELMDIPDETQSRNKNAEPVPFDEALARVRAFSATTYVPDVVRCLVSDEEFERLIHDSVARLPVDDRFGGRQLISAMLHTIDWSMRQQLPVRRQVLDLLRAKTTHLHGSRTLHQATRQLLEACHTPRHDNSVRYICNPAALHVEPSAEIPTWLVTQVDHGTLSVGTITIDTTRSVDLPPIVIPEESDEPRDDDSSPGRGSTH